MTFTELLSILQAIVEFPKELNEFVKLLRKTPEEQRQDVMKRVRDQKIKFDQNGRPTWE